LPGADRRGAHGLRRARRVGGRGARAALADLDDLRALLEAALVDEPPLALSDGGVIRETWNEALHALVSDAAEARRWIAGLEERERARRGCRACACASTASSATASR